jgi:hypothetical protein
VSSPAEQGENQITFWVHVGMAKTGSSFLQSSFVRNALRLEDEGILYPAHHTDQRALAGDTTSGNANELFDGERRGIAKTVRRDVTAARERGLSQVLYSSETLFYKILNRPLLVEMLRDEIEKVGGNLEIIVYIRNPLEHAFGAYSQQVKRSRETSSFADWLADFNPVGQFESFEEIVQEQEVKRCVRNYSVEKAALVRSFEKVLRIRPGTLVEEESRTVNRSLSVGELEVQRLVNHFVTQPTNTFFSDRWVLDLPNIDPKIELPFCTEKEISLFLDSCRPTIDRLNSLLPKRAQYQIEDPQHFLSRIPKNKPEFFCLSAGQLEVLCSGIASLLKQGSSAGISLSVRASEGSLVAETRVVYGSFAIAPNTIYDLSLEKLNLPAATRTLLASGLTNNRGAVAGEVQIGALAHGRYKIQLSSTSREGNPLELVNQISVDKSGKLLSLTPETMQSTLPSPLSKSSCWHRVRGLLTRVCRKLSKA